MVKADKIAGLVYLALIILFFGAGLTVGYNWLDDILFESCLIDDQIELKGRPFECRLVR